MIIARSLVPALALGGLVGCAGPRMLDARDSVAPPAASAPAQEQVVPESRFLLHAGIRELNDDTFYEPVEEPFVLGFEYVRNFSRETPAGLGLEIGFFTAVDYDDSLGADVTSIFLETDFGLRGRWNVGQAEFFAGVGPACILGVIDIENGPDDGDTTVGLYGHAGVLFDLDDNFALGLDVRSVTGTDISFGGFADTDADYTQLTLILGWRH